MPIADWGLSQGTIENFDREAAEERYKPYTGPKPPAGVYLFTVAKDQMRMQPGDEEKFPRWTALLILKARTREEKKYQGFRCFWSANVSDEKPEWYVPMCDVLGVTDGEFRRKTRLTEDGIIKSIGAWRNDGKQTLLGEVRYSDQYTNITWVGPVPDDSDLDDEDDEDDELE